MSDKSDLGNRMKSYESVPETRLMRRTPVILRLDGRAFHTLTRGLEKPIDWDFMQCMEDTAIALAESIDGCTLAYFQSDEISLLLTDYRTFYTEAWFDYRVQKMCSIASSIASLAFNTSLAENLPDLAKSYKPNFDCRAFNLTKDEVCNYFIWMQRDATRNSISSLAQAHFSHKSLHGVSSSGMQDKLMLEKGINWNDCPATQKRGACVVKRYYHEDKIDAYPNRVLRSMWVVDNDIPIFSKNRDYIDSRVNIEEKPDDGSIVS